MQNTLANKEKFFGQYWGQKILVTSKGLEKVGSRKWSESFYLRLKPLSKITVEDAIECLKKIYYPIGITAYVNRKSLGCTEIEMRDYFLNYSASEFRLDVIDDLRSKGYALPWNGLSVDDLINRKWISLHESD